MEVLVYVCSCSYLRIQFGSTGPYFDFFSSNNYAIFHQSSALFHVAYKISDLPHVTTEQKMYRFFFSLSYCTLQGVHQTP